MFGLNTRRELHVCVHFNWSLSVGHDKFFLLQCPFEENSKDDEESYGKPSYYWCKGFKVVNAICLLATLDVKSGLLLFDFIGDQVAFAMHCPH